jgi:hypothetical protein
MSGDEARLAIETQARALGPVLHAGMATALVSSRKRQFGLDYTKYPHLLPLMLRCALREHLETEALPPGWAVGGDPRLMGQLTLEHAELKLDMRFLKERRRTYPGGVPVAGRNPARRERWINQPLDIEMPGASPAAAPLSLLLLWDFVDGDLDEFSLRIVHTLAPGVYGAKVSCDLILDVQVGGSIFARLTFAGDAEDGDLFADTTIEIDEGGDSVGF